MGWEYIMTALISKTTLVMLALCVGIGCGNMTEKKAGSGDCATGQCNKTTAQQADAGNTNVVNNDVGPVDTYKCVPYCGAKECGDDGCGGKCGTCGTSKICSAGACVVQTAPAADAGSTDTGSTQVDAGTPDAGTPDAGSSAQDSGSPDTGPTPLNCNDNDPCTDDYVQSGSCWHAPKSCDDGNASTLDTCVSGACQHTPVTQPTQPGTATVCISTTDASIYMIVGDEWTSSTAHTNWGEWGQTTTNGATKQWCRTVDAAAVKYVGFLAQDVNGEMYPGWKNTLSNVIWDTTLKVKIVSSSGVIWDWETLDPVSKTEWNCGKNANGMPQLDIAFGCCYWSANNGKDYRAMCPIGQTAQITGAGGGQ